MIPTTPLDMTPTMENLKRELSKTGLNCQIDKSNTFIICKYTPTKKTLQHTIQGLNTRFGCRLVDCHHTQEGFYVAFEPFKF